MLYITKNSPPSEMLRKVSEIKSSPFWKTIKAGDTGLIRNAFEQLSKEPIRKSLLEEQHHLCAYCMRKIKNDGQKTSIEHWFPLSKDKDQALNYGNMLAVCDGGKKWKGNGKRILCCDACKEDEAALTISPLNKYQMDIIAYDKAGFIKTNPKDEKLNADINNILRLNGIWKNGQYIVDSSAELVKGRRDTYLQYERFVKKMGKTGKCTSSTIKRKIDEIETAEQRPEYAGVLLYFLYKKYQSLLKQGL